ncbi:MAG: GNAT family N-acetyltransferase [Mycobacteriaceae bacterium]
MLVPTAQVDVRELAVRHGLVAERFFLEMSRRSTGGVEVPAVPGTTLCRWEAGRSAEVHELLRTAFRGQWGQVDPTPQMWAEQLASHTFRPHWTILAVDTSTQEVVGVALNVAYEQDWAPQGYTEGYTDQLAVRASHRGRGIAGALLRASMNRFVEDHLGAAGLGVDSANPTGARQLYETLGYRPTAGTCIHQLTRPATAR